MSDGQTILLGPDGSPAAAGQAEQQLPYGGDFHGFLVDVGARAMRAERVFDDLIAETADDEGPLTPDQARLQLATSGASSNGYAVIALLKWIEAENGPGAAHKAASMVQFMYMNGGLGPRFDEDPEIDELWKAIKAKLAYQDEMLARRKQKLADAIARAKVEHRITPNFVTFTADCSCGSSRVGLGAALNSGELTTAAEAHEREVAAERAVRTDDYHQLRKHLAAVHGVDGAEGMGDLEALDQHERRHDPGPVSRPHPSDWWGRTRRDIIADAAAKRDGGGR